jgi:hypothetical protein
MKKIIRLTESDLSRIVRRTILEMENNKETEHLSEEEWENIWNKLRKVSKTFSNPENGNFVFGGLFFYYNDGVLEIGDQKLSDWARDLERGREILDKYANRLRKILDESELGLKLKVTSGNNFIIKKIKN